jgi:CRP-like cAMP-binding protein
MKKLPAREPARGYHRLRHRNFASLVAQGSEIFATLVPPDAYRPEIELFSQGSEPQEVYCIGRGLVKLVSIDPAGRQFIVGLRSPGWILGAASVIVQRPHLLTATTITSCHLHRISAETFLDLAKGNAQFAWYLQQILGREVYDQVTGLVRLGSSSARQRLEQLLLQFISSMETGKSEKGMSFELPLRHWEIAQLIAVTPEHLSRLLRRIEQEGVIQREPRRIVITDLQKFRLLSDLQELGINLGK